MGWHRVGLSSSGMEREVAVACPASNPAPAGFFAALRQNTQGERVSQGSSGINLSDVIAVGES